MAKCGEKVGEWLTTVGLSRETSVLILGPREEGQECLHWSILALTKELNCCPTSTQITTSKQCVLFSHFDGVINNSAFF